MRYYFLLFFAISLNSFSQNLQKLEENNGFRDIKLGSEITNYTDAIYITDQNIELSELYKETGFDLKYRNHYYISSKNTKYNYLGNAKILAILLKVFKGKIFGIEVVTEYSQDTFDLMKLAYGEPLMGKTSDSPFSSWEVKNIYCFFYRNHINSTLQKRISIIKYTDMIIEEQYELVEKEKEKEKQKEKQKKAISEF
jgi:hypothetical protein